MKACNRQRSQLIAHFMQHLKQILILQSRIRQDNFFRLQACQHTAKFCRQHFRLCRNVLSIEFTCRQIQPRNTQRITAFGSTQQIIIASLIQQDFFCQRTGGCQSDHLTVNQCTRSASLLCLFRCFHLFANSYFMPVSNQSRHMRFIGMIRYAAHRNIMRFILVCQG